MQDAGAGLLLPASPRAAGEARRYLRTQLLAWGLTGLVDDVVLLATELVTNAVVHTGSGPTISLLRVGEDAVRFEVEDDSPVLPRRHLYSDLSTTGRGLRLMESLAEEWGAEPRGSGKVVWCVVRPNDTITGFDGVDWLAEL